MAEKRDGGSAFLQGKKLDPLAFFGTASAAVYWPLPIFDLQSEPFLDPAHNLQVPSSPLGSKSLRSSIGWHEEGIGVQIQLEMSAALPTDGNRVDLFVDTRDRKEVRGLSRFCHHFRYSLPDGTCRSWMEGSGSEISHHVGKEQRPLALPAQLFSVCRADSGGIVMRCWIPATALYGYDPDLFGYLGFHFSVIWASCAHPFSSSSDEVSTVLSPALWTSLRLQREKNGLVNAL